MNVLWVLLFMAATGESATDVLGLANWRLQANYETCKENAKIKQTELRAEHPKATIVVECVPVAASDMVRA
jgi:hypothetical protein